MSNVKSNIPPVGSEVKTAPGRPMTPPENLILHYCEQYFHEAGRLPGPNEIESAGFSKELFMGCIKLPSFNLGLDNRGITPYVMLDEDGRPPKNLTPMQLLTINTVMDDVDSRSKVKKLSDLGVPTATWNAWLKDPVVSRHLQLRSERQFSNGTWEAHSGLMHAVKNGDVSAIKLYYEVSGRYVPQQTKGVDIQVILIKVIEIIQKHVTNRDLQALIAQDLIQLTEGNAASFDGQPLVAPELKDVATKTIDVQPFTPVGGLNEAMPVGGLF